MDSSLPEQLLGKYGALRSVDGMLRRLERLAIARSDLVLAVCEDLASRARGYATKTPVDVVEDVSLLGDGAPTATSRTCAATCRTAACSPSMSAISSTTKAST